MDGWAEGESDPFPFEIPGNAAGVPNGAGQTVQLRHDRRVALAQRRCQRPGEAGPVPAGPWSVWIRSSATPSSRSAFRCASRSWAWVEQRAYPILIAMAGLYGKALSLQHSSYQSIETRSGPVPQGGRFGRRPSAERPATGRRTGGGPPGASFHTEPEPAPHGQQPPPFHSTLPGPIGEIRDVERHAESSQGPSPRGVATMMKSDGCLWWNLALKNIFKKDLLLNVIYFIFFANRGEGMR